jgi:hypothetical protein
VSINYTRNIVGGDINKVDTELQKIDAVLQSTTVGLSSVTTDATLTGNGTVASPLTVVNSNSGMKGGNSTYYLPVSIPADRFWSSRFVAPLSCAMSKIILTTGSTGAGNILVGIYADNAGNPGALLRSCPTKAIAATDDFIPLLFSLTSSLNLVGGTYYHMAVLPDAAVVFYYANGTTGGWAGYTDAIDYHSGLPNPAPAPGATYVPITFGIY